MTRASRGLRRWAAAGLIAALALVGVAQASWSDQINLSGTVTTGSIESSWFAATCNDNESGGGDIADWSVAPDPSDPSGTLLVTIDEGYAGYQLDCDLFLANTGGLPVQIASTSTTSPGGADVTAMSGSGAGALRPCGSTPSWGAQPGGVPTDCQGEVGLTVEIGNGVQPGDVLAFDVSVVVELAT